MVPDDLFTDQLGGQKPLTTVCNLTLWEQMRPLGNAALEILQQLSRPFSQCQDRQHSIKFAAFSVRQ